MTQTTTNLAFRYPEASDYASGSPTGASVPRAVQELAEDVDDFLGLEDPHLVSGLGYENGWTDGGATATYYKDPFDRVHLAGTIKDGPSGATAFTLPAGYRPPVLRNLPAIHNTREVAVISITSAGEVSVTWPDPTTTDVSLDGISFRI